MTVCAIGGTEIILISVVVILIFGGKKLPELMKGLGQGVRQFKHGLNDEPEKPQLSPEERDRLREEYLARLAKEKEERGKTE